MLVIGKFLAWAINFGDAKKLQTVRRRTITRTIPTPASSSARSVLEEMEAML
jgi:hypothetical protein